MFEVIIWVLGIILALIGVIVFFGSLSSGFDINMFFGIALCFSPLIWAIYRRKQRKLAEEQQMEQRRIEAEKERIAERKVEEEREKERKLAEEEAERNKRLNQIKDKIENSKKHFDELQKQLREKIIDVFNSNNFIAEDFSIKILRGQLSEEYAHSVCVRLWYYSLFDEEKEKYEAEHTEIDNKYHNDLSDFEQLPNDLILLKNEYNKYSQEIESIEQEKQERDRLSYRNDSERTFIRSCYDSKILARKSALFIPRSFSNITII